MTIEKYQQLENSGLLTDHYFILQRLYRKEPIPDTMRVRGYLNLLVKKGYLEGTTLTETAIALVEDDVEHQPEITEESVGKEVPFTKWAEMLHQKCQQKLMELIGKKQKTDKINGTSYSFLCNARDLHANLYKVFTLYKLGTKDREVVERCILKHIEKCNKANNWFPVLYYYIFKNNKSLLVTDVESMDESEESDSPQTMETYL